MPAKMSSDMPFPMPRSVICSPSHMMKVVPAVSVSTVISMKPMPGFRTKPPCDSMRPMAMPNDWITPRMMVRYRVHCVILRRPSSPSFCSFSSVGTTTVINCRMIDAVMYGMMPSAKIVSRRMLPPANRSKKPKIEPCCEEKKSAHRCRLMPGVGIWLPRRYTASSPSVNRSRLRRSGTRNMFANASKNFMVTLIVPRLTAAALLLLRLRAADYLRGAPGLLNLFHRRLRKLVRLDRDLPRQLARAENLETIAELADDSQFHQPVGIEAVAIELLQPAEVDDRVLLLEN